MEINKQENVSVSVDFVPAIKESIHSIPEAIKYSLSVVSAVWERTREKGEFYYFSTDIHSNIIAKYEYGRRQSHGWVIEIIDPNGDLNSIDNMRAVHWKNKKG